MNPFWLNHIFLRWVLQPPRLIFLLKVHIAKLSLGHFDPTLQAKNCIYLKRSMAGGHVTGTGETHWQPDLSEMKWTNQDHETLKFSVFVNNLHLMSFPGWDPQGILKDCTEAVNDMMNSPGYADLENPVFFRETTQMLLGLARFKKSARGVVCVWPIHVPKDHRWWNGQRWWGVYVQWPCCGLSWNLLFWFVYVSD